MAAGMGEVAAVGEAAEAEEERARRRRLPEFQVRFWVLPKLLAAVTLMWTRLPMSAVTRR